MTIKPGEPWGVVGAVPSEVIRVDDDAGLRHLVQQGKGFGPTTPVAPRRGDCWRAAGGRRERDRIEAGDEVASLPWDVLEIWADDRHLWSTAHVVARGRLWSGEVVAIMNVDHIGRWDVAPRAHPNDGRLDVVHVDGAMSWRARWQAKQRLPLGTHVPHPSIRVRQAAEIEFHFSRSRRLVVDGVSEGRVRHLRVQVHTDRAVLCV